MGKTIHVNAVYYNGHQSIKFADSVFNEDKILDAKRYYDEWVSAFKNFGWEVSNDECTTDNLLDMAVNKNRNLSTTLVGRCELTPTGKVCRVNLWFTKDDEH